MHAHRYTTWNRIWKVQSAFAAVAGSGLSATHLSSLGQGLLSHQQLCCCDLLCLEKLEVVTLERNLHFSTSSGIFTSGKNNKRREEH